MTIENQAVRLQRLNDSLPVDLDTQTVNIRPMLDEIYLILTNQDLPTSGATEISLAPPNDIPNDAGGTPVIKTPFAVDPLPPWALPGLDLPGMLFDPTVPENPTDLQDLPQNQNQNDNSERQSKLNRFYFTMPGTITATNNDGTYRATLLAEGIPGKSSREVFVQEVNFDSGFSVGQGVLVTGILVVKTTTTTVTRANAPTATNTKIEIKDERYFCQIGGGGGGGTPAKITEGGPGKSYTATLYPDGVDGAAGDSVSMKQLDIDDNEQIPAGTWVIAAKGRATGEDGKAVWYCQVPIWL